jgi:hypothetical protein
MGVKPAKVAVVAIGVVIVRVGAYVTTNMGVALTWSDGMSGGGPAVANVAGDRAA